MKTEHRTQESDKGLIPLYLIQNLKSYYSDLKQRKGGGEGEIIVHFLEIGIFSLKIMFLEKIFPTFLF